MKYPAFYLLCALAALMPLVHSPAFSAPGSQVHWPETYDGLPLRAVALTEREQEFHANFPGAVARFTDGRREYIFRWVTAGTRKLHSGADCFRGLGYQVEQGTPEIDAHGDRWSCFDATRGVHRLRVRERITSPGEGQSWTDVSAWYWSTLLRTTHGPWLSVTIAEAAAS